MQPDPILQPKFQRNLRYAEILANQTNF